MGNPLSGILTPQIRKWVYALYGIAVVVVGCCAIAGVDVEKAPDVLTYLGGVLSVTAASNVPTPDTNEPGGKA